MPKIRLCWGAALAALCVVVVWGGEEPVRAQGDWSLTRPSSAGRRPGVRSTSPRRPRPTGRGRGRTRRRAGSEPRASTSRRAGPRSADRARRDQLIQRYLGIVERDPRESFAFRRLLDLHRERDGNVAQLVEGLRRRAAADPEAYAPRMLLGHLQRAQGELDSARTLYRRAAQLRPQDPAPLAALARLEREAGQAERARTLYDQAIERTRDRLAREELLRRVAQVAMEQRDYEAARAYYRRLSQGAGTIYSRTAFARALVSAEQWSLAVAEYQRVLRSVRGDNRVLPPILLELSRAQRAAGDLNDAIASLQRALRSSGRGTGVRAEVYAELMTAYRQADRLAELAQTLRSSGRRGFEESRLLGQIEDEIGNDEAALTAYRAALRARRSDIDTRLAVINVLTRTGRLEDAIEEYRSLIRVAPRQPQFVIALAERLLQVDRRDDAMQMLRTISRRNPRDVALHQRLVQLYSRLDEDELVRQESELLVRIDPTDATHVVALGSQLHASGDRRAALATWERILSIERDRGRAHFVLAGVLADHDMLSEAVDHYRQAVQANRDELTYVRGLATALERIRENDAAETQWRRVLELASSDRIARREARERIVGIWVREGQLPRAIGRLRSDFRSEEPDLEAGRFLAEAYRRRGARFHRRAAEVLARLIELAPGDIESMLALERLRTQRGDLAGAIAVLRRLRDADPRRANHYLARMAEHALALYRDEEALRYAAEAVRRDPDDPLAHRRLGDLYRARQEIEPASASYRRALELNERLYPVYFQLAELELAAGRSVEANELYQRVLRISPDDDLVARAARASTQISLGNESLGTLERELLSLSLAHPERPVYRRLLVELYDAYAGPMVQRVHRGGPGAVQARAELARIGTRGIKPLLEALADNDPSQRRVALSILGHLGNPNAAAPLLALAENGDLDTTLRLQALVAAGSVARPTLVPRFVALTRGDDRRLRGLATWALARIGGRESMSALLRLLSAEESEVRGFAALGLVGQPSRANAARLARLLHADAHQDVVFAATWALANIGGDAEVAVLTGVLRSESPAAPVAAYALGEIGTASTIAPLSSALFAVDPEIRAAAARALRRALRARAAEASEPVDSLPPPGIFESPAAFVPRLLPQELGPPLNRLDDHVEGLVEAARTALGGHLAERIAALSVLGARADGLAFGPLTEGVDEWPQDARERVSSALHQAAQALLPELAASTLAPELAIQVEAVRLLVRIDGEMASRAVVHAISDGPPSVRRAALESLADCPHPPSAPVAEQLADVLRSDRNWSMRTRAAQGLGRSDDERSRQALRQALRDDRYAFVREAAARSLGAQVLAPMDVTALERTLTSDGEPRVRMAAFRALVGHRPSRERARELVRRDAEPAVRALLEDRGSTGPER